MTLKHILWTLLLCCCAVTAGAQTYRVGDLYTAPDGSQGIVFFVFPDGTGGWVVALNDAPESCNWGSYVDITDLVDIMPTNYQELLADTSGYTNTAIIRNQLNNNNYAAGKVDFANGWYLPAMGQLRMLYSKRSILDTLLVAAGGTKFANGSYWSSSEVSSTNAWEIEFGSHYYQGQCYSTSKYYSCHVRAVRTFTYESSYVWSTGDTTASITVAPSQTMEYALSVSNPLGCSDQDTISMTVNIPYHEVVRDTVCGSYERNGVSYTSSGIYVNRFTSVAGCDSVITLYLSLSPAPQVSISQQPYFVCGGDSITLQTTVSNIGGSFPVTVGDILCTDGSILKPSEWSASGKTAKGVVFYVDSTNIHGWAVNLADDVEYTQPWGGYYTSGVDTDIPDLPNVQGSRNANMDHDGYGNTQKIRAMGDASVYPAAWAMDFDNGWYLPAIGQLSVLYSELMKVDASLQLVNGSPFGTDNYFYYWSSTEGQDTHAWELVYGGDLRLTQKNYYYRVRSVRDF